MSVNPLQQQACSLMELGTFFAERDTCGVHCSGQLVVWVFDVATVIKVYRSSSITNTPFFSFFPIPGEKLEFDILDYPGSCWYKYPFI